MKKSISAIFLLIFFCISCSKVPLTGRRQLNLIPSSQINTLANQEYDQVLDQSKLSTNQQQTQLIKNVGKRLSTAIETYMRQNGMAEDIDDFQWEFNLIQDDNTVNAWAMPGGKVAFYTGIMPICQDEEGVAVVMSHEIAHAIADHGNERMSQQLALQLGGAGLAIALQEKPQLTQQLALAAFGLGTQIGILLPYSRSHESEADEIGVYIMALAGYDPHEAIPFWQRMDKQGGAKPPEFLSTHPDPENRIRNIEKAIPKAMRLAKRQD